MMDPIRRFFRKDQEQASSEAGDERASPEDLRLAACALLLELAYADDEFTDAERAQLESAVCREFGLSPEEADELLRRAQERRDEAVDLWSFTNLIAEEYSLGQKMVLAEAMWGLVYADGRLASREDYLMRKISGLLRLEPGYLAEARKRAEESRPPDAVSEGRPD